MSDVESQESGGDFVHLVSIEGGIGVGKSTILDTLRKVRPSLKLIEEPVKEWENTGLLQHMYNKTIPPGTFQIAALSTRMAPILRAVNEGHRFIVTERSPYSDYEVFTKANLSPNSVELTAYEMAYDALMTAMPSRIRLYNIYLSADVDTLLKRMAWRARDAERTETAAARADRRVYLETLEEHHKNFFNASAEGLRVAVYERFRIDATQDVTAVASQVLETLSDIVPVKIELNKRPRPLSEGEGAASS